MKCLKCRGAMGMLKCKECSGNFCSGCIQLEVHTCSGLENKKKEEKELLAKKLPLIIASKIVKL